MNIDLIRQAAMHKHAAAVLTPEAEQAAMAGGDPMAAGGMPPGGAMPPDGAMPPGGAMPPDAGMMPPGGMPPAGAPAGAPPAGGAGLPPEILQDQAFIQWMGQNGAQLDQASGTFIDMATGQPIPPEMVMQAYQMYAQQAQGGAMPPAGGAPAGAMPPDAGMMPPGGGGMPPDAGAAPPAGGDPSEMMQDQEFLAFMQQAMGCTLDPATGTFVDPSGQPLDPAMAQSAYEQFKAAQGQQPGGEGGAPGAEPGGEAPKGEGGKLTPEIMEQLQSAIDSSLQAFTAQLEKQQQAYTDKLDKVLMMLQAMQDTDDQRDKDTRQRDKTLQDELNEELNPKVASAAPPVALANAVNEALDLPEPAAPAKNEPRVLDVTDLLFGGVK